MSGKNQIYQFNNIQVDVQTFKVLKEGSPLPLEPKAFEVLVYLINHRGRLVEKSELLDAVWGDSFVTPNALTRVIAQLRKMLGDDAKEAKYIETVPTRGYRFIAELRASQGISPDGGENGQRSDRRPTVKTIIFASAVILLLIALFFSLILLYKPDMAEQLGVLRTVQITATPELDLFPAFSPDAGAIAYTSLRNGNHELFVRQLAPGGREIQITTDGAQNLQPAWSPDGKMIAYHSRNRRGIWLVPALGGVVRQLTDFGSEPAWSRNGEWIAFQSDAPADLGQAAFGAMPPSTIWIVSTRGGPPQQITKVGTPPGGHGVPAWSPDGKRLVFVTYDIGLSEIWSVSPKGEDLKRVLHGKGHFFDPVFSPDGRHLFFSTASGNFYLWRLPLAADTGLPAGEPVEIANTGAALARHLTMAPDGRRLAYSSLTLLNNIGSVTLKPNSHGAVGDPKLITQDTNYRKNHHAFSPDGKTLAYSVWRMGAEGEVWLVDAEGNNSRQLTVEPAAVLGWLPQTDELALAKKERTGNRLLRVDVNNGRQTPLTGLDIEVRPMGRLSPDSGHIAFNSRASGTINVWTVSLSDGRTRQLTFDKEMMGFPCWSPDSKSLAIEVKRGDDTHIAIVSHDGGTPVQLTFDRGQSWPGSWSPDGDKIAFAGFRKGVWNIWWVSRTTRAQKQVTNYTKPNIYVRYPGWSPRGNQIVYEYAETIGNIWMMELK
jgi:Tol biopolymer transport system component/DNA-binding winged helix-turn-helix (wHTH) protein